MSRQNSLSLRRCFHVFEQLVSTLRTEILCVLRAHRSRLLSCFWRAWFSKVKEHCTAIFHRTERGPLLDLVSLRWNMQIDEASQSLLHWLLVVWAVSATCSTVSLECCNLWKRLDLSQVMSAWRTYMCLQAHDKLDDLRCRVEKQSQLTLWRIVSCRARSTRQVIFTHWCNYALAGNISFMRRSDGHRVLLLARAICSWNLLMRRSRYIRQRRVDVNGPFPWLSWRWRCASLIRYLLSWRTCSTISARSKVVRLKSALQSQLDRVSRAAEAVQVYNQRVVVVAVLEVWRDLLVERLQVLAPSWNIRNKGKQDRLLSFDAGCYFENGRSVSPTMACNMRCHGVAISPSAGSTTTSDVVTPDASSIATSRTSITPLDHISSPCDTGFRKKSLGFDADVPCGVLLDDCGTAANNRR